MQSSYHYKQLQAYQQARMNVGKAQQVILLYDGIIRFLQQAHNAERDGDIVQRAEVINKAITIVMGLQSCLDMENYPEISATLYDYYETLYIRMYALQRDVSEEDYATLINDVKQMRDAWVVAEEKQRITTTPSAPTTGAQEEIASLMATMPVQQPQFSEGFVYSA